MNRTNFVVFDAHRVVDESGNKHIAVKCQLCNSIHIHGNNPKLDVGEESHKMAHCNASDRPDMYSDVDSYYFELVDDDLYQLMYGKYNSGPIIVDKSD